jgi:hypothetical protein
MTRRLQYGGFTAGVVPIIFGIGFIVLAASGMVRLAAALVPSTRPPAPSTSAVPA